MVIQKILGVRFKSELARLDDLMILLRKRPNIEITTDRLNQFKNEIERIKITLDTRQDCSSKTLSNYLAFHCCEGLRLYTDINEQDIKSGLQNPYAKLQERQLSKMYEELKTGLSEIIIAINRRKVSKD